MVQTENNFITIKDKSFWRHNDRIDSFCNFYGSDYPWEIELSYNNGQQTSTLSSLEYSLEAYTYKNSTDKYHERFFNFDELVIYNSEQISGLIKLEQKPKTMISPFPLFLSNHMKAEYAKVEQKYRIDQFFDLTKNRAASIPLLELQANGYRKVINKVAVDYGKTDKKKFRHNYGNVVLRRTVSGDKSMRLRLVNEKEVASAR